MELKTVFLLMFIAGTAITLKNIFIFVDIKKHKKYYFYFIGFGGMFKMKLFGFCLTVSKKNKMPRDLILVKRNGGMKRLVRLTAAKPPNMAVIRLLMRNTKIKELILNIQLSAGDAKNTALICGSLQSALYAFICSQPKKINAKKAVVSIIPEFTAPHMDLNAKCILKLDLANIIIAAIKEKIKKAVEKNAPDRKHYAGNDV